MSSVGENVTYIAPTDVLAGDQRILARVGPGTENAAIVTGISGDMVNLLVFPDQQEPFHLRDMTATEDPVKGSVAAVGAVAPSRTKTKTPGQPAAPSHRAAETHKPETPDPYAPPQTHKPTPTPSRR